MKITAIKFNGSVDDPDYIREISARKDIYYIELYKRVPLLHTVHGKYLQIVTLDGFYQVLKDFGFEHLDSVNVVNMNKIVDVDPVLLLVKFDDGSFTSVSANNYKRLFAATKKAERFA